MGRAMGAGALLLRFSQPGQPFPFPFARRRAATTLRSQNGSSTLLTLAARQDDCIVISLESGNWGLLEQPSSPTGTGPQRVVRLGG